MNQKSALSAVCLCLMASAANAEIVNYTSYYDQSVAAVGDSPNGNLINNYFHEVLADVTSYSNTLYASATDSFTLNGSTYSASANASSTLTMNADIDAGVFSASGSYGVGSSDWLSAFSGSQARFSFELTSAYAYTLDMTTSAGSSSGGAFYGSGAEIFSSGDASNAAISVHQSGILGAGLVDIIAGIYVQDQFGNIEQGSFGGYLLPPKPVGSFQYTLTLTPVPVPEPEAWGLMLAGLGLVGWAARRRQQAAV